MQSTNLKITYDRFRPYKIPGEHRWIGRCKKCGATHKVEGEITLAWAPEQKWQIGAGAGSTRAGHDDYVVRGTGASSGLLYTMGDHGSNPYKIPVPCGDHWANLQRVTEGTKKSKHECGARCTNATGPNCDCRCKGRMHGSGL